MKVSKEQVVEFIRERGDENHLEAAERDLPATLQIPGDEGLLARFGVDPDDLTDEPNPVG